MSNLSDFLMGPTGIQGTQGITGTTGTQGTSGNINPSINDQTGTTYTVQSTDNSNIIACNNASAITVTIPTGLGVGFSTVIIQKGAGQVTVVAGGGATLRSRTASAYKTAGQWGGLVVSSIVSNEYIIAGDSTT